MGTRLAPGTVFASHLRDERYLLAAKIRTARALLGWSQQRFADEVGVTQRAIHKLETAAVEPRRATALAIEAALARRRIIFDRGDDGSLRVSAPPDVFTLAEEHPDADRLRIVAGSLYDRS
jgi:transcriptional regulator with XRE-family HTH domain